MHRYGSEYDPNLQSRPHRFGPTPDKSHSEAGQSYERHAEDVPCRIFTREPAKHKSVLARHQRLAALLGPAADRVPRGFDRALAELNVTSPQSMVLVMVGTYQPLSSADLARLTFLTRQAINVIIRNLEQRRQSFARRMRCMGGS